MSQVYARFLSGLDVYKRQILLSLSLRLSLFHERPLESRVNSISGVGASFFAHDIP